MAVDLAQRVRAPALDPSFVGRLYEAALDDSVWSTLAAETARQLQATSSVLHLRGADGSVRLLFATPNLRPTSKSLQDASHYWRHNDRDLYVQAAMRRPMQVLTSEVMFPNAYLENTPFFNEWSRYLDIYHLVGAYIPLPNGAAATFAVHRPRGDHPFAREQIEGAVALLPHVVRALEIRTRLRLQVAEKAAADQVLEHYACAVIAVSEDGKLVCANRSGDALLREGAGLGLVAGRVVSKSHGDQDKLDAAIARAAKQARLVPLLAAVNPAKSHLSMARRGHAALSVLITPLRLGLQLLEQPVVLLIARDPEQPSPDVEALMELFGLTRAEAVVAGRIAEGLTAESVARELHVTINTVRTQLRRALLKTATERQAELAAVVLRSTAMLRAPAQATASVLKQKRD